eukprot:801687-Pleurochrysis_carterae.AAC.1
MLDWLGRVDIDVHCAQLSPIQGSIHVSSWLKDLSVVYVVAAALMTCFNYIRPITMARTVEEFAPAWECRGWRRGKATAGLGRGKLESKRIFDEIVD